MKDALCIQAKHVMHTSIDTAGMSYTRLLDRSQQNVEGRSLLVSTPAPGAHITLHNDPSLLLNFKMNIGGSS